MSKQILPGTFVRYLPKNELGLVGEMKFSGARCWYHMGGTKATTPYNLIEPISDAEAIAETFSNECCKASLLERHRRLMEGGDVSDLIDDADIRSEVRQALKKGGL